MLPNALRILESVADRTFETIRPDLPSRLDDFLRNFKLIALDYVFEDSGR